MFRFNYFIFLDIFNINEGKGAFSGVSTRGSSVLFYQDPQFPRRLNAPHPPQQQWKLAEPPGRFRPGTSTFIRTQLSRDPEPAGEGGRALWYPQGQRFSDGAEGGCEEEAVFGSDPSIFEPAAGKNELWNRRSQLG